MRTVTLGIQLFIEDSRSGAVVGLEQLNQKIVCKMGPLGLEKARAYTALKDYGWTITTGLNYGADFLLYSGNPEDFHAEFCVVIREVDPQWRDIVSWNRVASASKKSLLLVMCSCERMDYYVFKRFQPDEERSTKHRQKSNNFTN